MATVSDGFTVVSVSVYNICCNTEDFSNVDSARKTMINCLTVCTFYETERGRVDGKLNFSLVLSSVLR